MALTLNVVSSQYATPTAFSNRATVNLDVGSGPGRAILVFALLDANGIATTLNSCRVGSTAGSGGTLMTAGAAGAFGGTATHPTKLFTLVDPSQTGVQEIWMACSDGNRKPGILAICVQASDGRALTVGDLGISNVTMSGSTAALQTVTTPGVDAVAICFLRGSGFVLGTASSGSAGLGTGWTNAADTIFEAFQKPGAATSVDVGWQPGSINQTHVRHFLSLSGTAIVDNTSPTITGPTGAAADPSVSISIPENTTAVGTWTANEVVTWSVSGTDAALVTIDSNSGACSLHTAANFEVPVDSGGDNVLNFTVTATDGSANVSTQTVVLTITAVNEAPTFIGPNISIPIGVAGAGIAAQTLSSKFSDPDSGDTATYSKGGSWPVGPTLSAGGVLGGSYPASGITSGLTVVRTDLNGLFVASNSFSIDSTAEAIPVFLSGAIPAQALTVSVAYAVALAGYFGGNVAPVTYSVFSGTLPTGVNLNSTTGALSGTPSVAGTFNAVVRATDNSANVADSGNITFVVAPPPTPPVILSDPSPLVSVVAPAPATFTVSASGTPPFTYQWQRSPGGNGIFADVLDGIGGTTAIYTTPATTITGGTANNGDTYRCIVTNSAGSAVSAVSTLSVVAPLDLTEPTLTGSLVASSILTTSYTLTWPSASDNVAVFGYELSLDGGTTYFPVGMLLTYNITNRVPGATDQCRVRAYDQVGNRSASLSLAVTPTATTLTTDPLENDSGSLHLGVLVHYSWYPAGRIGALAGITPIEGTATTHATTGVLSIGGLLLGSGIIMTCVRNSSAATDDIHYQALSVV